MISLKKNGKSFYELIKDLNIDSQLFEYIASNLNYFKDVSIYEGEEILFYKNRSWFCYMININSR